MKHDWNFQRGESGGGGLRNNPFSGGGMDIFFLDIFWITSPYSWFQMSHKLPAKFKLVAKENTFHESIKRNH